MWLHNNCALFYRSLGVQSVFIFLILNLLLIFPGPSNLTTTAIAKHNANSTENVSDAVSHMSLDEGDNQSFSGNTFNTWASNWTDCTNATFSQVHRYVSSNSAMHKEVSWITWVNLNVIKWKPEHFGISFLFVFRIIFSKNIEDVLLKGISHEYIHVQLNSHIIFKSALGMNGSTAELDLVV